MGMFDALFGGGGGSQAGHGAMRHGMFNPFTFSGAWGGMGYTPGYTPTKKEWRHGMRPTQGSFSSQMSPQMEMLRQGFLNNAMGELGGMGQSSGGYLGISPEMFAEFQQSGKGMGAMGNMFRDASRGYLEQEQGMEDFNFQDTYEDRLGNMRALDQDWDRQARMGNADDQWGKGILASTAGQYQTQGFEEAMAKKDLMRHDSAFGQAGQAQGLDMAQRQMLMNGAMGFGGLANQVGNDRFARMMGLFGAGQNAENSRMGRAQGYLGGVGSIDQFMANMFQMSGNMGAQQSQANQGAWAPYVQSKMMNDQFGMDFLGGLMGGMSMPVGGGGGGWNMGS
jgi:hypothetical protein